MRYFYCLIIVCFFIPAISVAQSFKQGYVITTKGDTLQGFIHYSSSDEHSLLFKPSASGVAQKLKPVTTRAFHTADYDYHNYLGTVTTDLLNPNNVPDGRDTSFIIDSIFVKVLQKGKAITLYSFVDNFKPRFYVTEKDDELPVELIYRVYYDMNVVDPSTAKGRTVNEDTYLRQLYALALKYNRLTDKLQWMFDNARYDKAYLIPIAKYINDIK